MNWAALKTESADQKLEEKQYTWNINKFHLDRRISTDEKKLKE